MDIFALVGISLVGAVLCLVLRESKPEYAMVVSIACGVLIFSMILVSFSPVFETIKSLVSKVNINASYIKAIIKTLGICYITAFSSDACRDAGQTAIAGKIELAGKVCVVIISLPLFDELVKTAFSLINM